jgi:hypothetical protein
LQTYKDRLADARRLVDEYQAYAVRAEELFAKQTKPRDKITVPQPPDSTQWFVPSEGAVELMAQAALAAVTPVPEQ